MKTLKTLALSTLIATSASAATTDAHIDTMLLEGSYVGNDITRDVFIDFIGLECIQAALLNKELDKAETFYQIGKEFHLKNWAISTEQDYIQAFEDLRNDGTITGERWTFDECSYMMEAITIAEDETR
jgi:hypothetical protein